jgi:hypothetical protein
LLAVLLYHRPMATDRPARDRAGGEADLPGTFLAELRALLAQRRQIEAIRRYRLETGADLATATAAIDKLGRADAPLSPGGLVRLIALFFWLCASLAAAAAGGQAYHRWAVSHTWSRVEAEVVKCSVVTHKPAHNPPFSTLACEFRYNVRGAEFTAKTASSGIPSAEQEAAMRKWVAQHRPGSRQVIRYDPADPHQISLGDADAPFQADTPAHRLRLAGFFTGAGVLFVALAAWLANRRQRERRQENGQ